MNMTMNIDKRNEITRRRLNAEHSFREGRNGEIVKHIERQLMDKYRVELRKQTRQQSITTCRDVVALWMASEGCGYPFTARYLGLTNHASAIAAVNRAAIRREKEDRIFMHWHDVIKNIINNQQDEALLSSPVTNYSEQ